MTRKRIITIPPGSYRTERIVRPTLPPGVVGAWRGDNLLADGDMEDAGVGEWTVADGTLSKETWDPAEGVRSLRVTSIASGVTEYPRCYQANIFTVGLTYRITGYVKSDGILTPRVYVGTNIFVGTTSTSWQPFDETIVAADDALVVLATASAPAGTEYFECDDLYVSLEG